jgi:hypothetical protein
MHFVAFLPCTGFIGHTPDPSYLETRFTHLFKQGAYINKWIAHSFKILVEYFSAASGIYCPMPTYRPIGFIKSFSLKQCTFFSCKLLFQWFVMFCQNWSLEGLLLNLVVLSVAHVIIDLLILSSEEVISFVFKDVFTVLFTEIYGVQYSKTISWNGIRINVV